MNPFRELLNGAQAPSSRDIPIEFSPIQPMSEAAQQQSQGNDMVLSELQRLRERTLAFEEMLKGRVSQPQMQMPNVAPNKNAALLGGLAALIGALTGDKSAVPAFGQFAGGLQQDAQAKAQRLLQEQQMKMQSQAQKDKALGDLLGFQLEDAQNAYSRANAADVANRKATKESADAEAERAYKIWQTNREIEGRTKIAGINNESQEKRAWLRSRGKANEVEALMQSLGLSEDAAINYVYDSELKAAQADLAKSNKSLADSKTKYTDTLTKYYPQKFDFDKKKEEFKQWSATEGLRLRQAAESRMAAGGGPKVSYKFEDDPAWYSLETRLKNLDLENMSHDLQNVGYAEELKKAEGYQEGPTKQQLLKFYQEQISVHSKRMQEIQKRRIAIRAEQLKREAEIMDAKRAGAGTVRTIGTAPPRLSGNLRPGGGGTVAPINPMNLPGVGFKPAPQKKSSK